DDAALERFRRSRFARGRAGGGARRAPRPVFLVHAYLPFSLSCYALAARGRAGAAAVGARARQHQLCISFERPEHPCGNMGYRRWALARPGWTPVVRRRQGSPSRWERTGPGATRRRAGGAPTWRRTPGSPPALRVDESRKGAELL